jgi:hypothetical protein
MRDLYLYLCERRRVPANRALALAAARLSTTDLKPGRSFSPVQAVLLLAGVEPRQTTERFFQRELPVTVAIAGKRPVRASPIGEGPSQLVDLEVAWVGVFRKRSHRFRQHGSTPRTGQPLAAQTISQ